MPNKPIVWMAVIMLGFLVSCGTSSVASPAPVLSPTSAKTPTVTATVALTRAAPNKTPTSEYTFATLTPFPFPPETALPLSETDSLYLQLTQKGYRLMSSGSLIGPQGFTYSAHLFINPDLTPRYNSADAATKDAILVAFYRRDGAKDVLLGVQYLPALEHDYGTEYAVYAGVFNWNWQYDVLGMDIYFGAEQLFQRC